MNDSEFWTELLFEASLSLRRLGPPEGSKIPNMNEVAEYAKVEQLKRIADALLEIQVKMEEIVINLGYFKKED